MDISEEFSGVARNFFFYVYLTGGQCCTREVHDHVPKQYVRMTVHL